jgi:5'(3')-deoxyribonucleotidase
MRTLFIDIDNTTGRLMEHYLETYNEMFNDNLDVDVLKTYDKYDFPTYTFSKKPDSTFKIEKEKMISIFNTANFWFTIPVFPKVSFILKKLYEKYDCYFLTSPSFGSPMFFFERLQWVKENFPFFDYHKIIFSQNKSLFKDGSILIDDYGENIDNWVGPKIKIK